MTICQLWRQQELGAPKYRERWLMERPPSSHPRPRPCNNRALEAAVKERQRLAVEYGIDAAAARGGWLAEEEALQVRRRRTTYTPI